ncbi:MAG: hypothetical protein KME23_08090 [Goleter apudmare HA4340-LM2]|nr:hypothetical protein [Goleter apudmare HA4340-LM2]
MLKVTSNAGVVGKKLCNRRTGRSPVAIILAIAHQFIAAAWLVFLG